MHEDQIQSKIGEKAMARIWERLGEVKEIQETEEKVQREEGTLQ